MNTPPLNSDRDRRPLGIPGRALAIAFSAAVHLFLLSVLFLPQREPPKALEARLMSVTLIDLAAPVAKEVTPSAPAPPSPAKPLRLKRIARPAPATPDVEPVPTGEAETTQAGVELSEGDLAGATTAGSGPPGRPCDMVQRLQNALRKDADVRAALTGAHRAAASKAIVIWNGDWVTSPGQEGKGLAGVREAMMIEIAFAPAACRAEPMHGLVLVSLGDDPTSARLAFGSGKWRWSDMLFPRSGVPGHALPRL